MKTIFVMSSDDASMYSCYEFLAQQPKTIVSYSSCSGDDIGEYIKCAIDDANSKGAEYLIFGNKDIVNHLDSVKDFSDSKFICIMHRPSENWAEYYSKFEAFEYNNQDIAKAWFDISIHSDKGQREILSFIGYDESSYIIDASPNFIHAESRVEVEAIDVREYIQKQRERQK